MNLNLRPATWTAAHADRFAAACGSDPLCTPAVFGAMAAGGCPLLDVYDGERCIGCVLLALHHADREAVIVAGVGYCTLAQLRGALRAVVGWCERAGFVHLRTHVQRPALARVWAGLGFQQSEIVMRRSHGQS
ncbi:hypothetical protein [Chitiniphilus eburneus]|uniref:hypothetical protein n=1 Tax=Chitiniphilus eburneus TaxID=2571148 RepID=UPI0035D0C8BC